VVASRIRFRFRRPPEEESLLKFDFPDRVAILTNLTIMVVSKSGKHDEGHATLSCYPSMGPDDWAGLLTKKSVSNE
jgi:hypothetical protein